MPLPVLRPMELMGLKSVEDAKELRPETNTAFQFSHCFHPGSGNSCVCVCVCVCKISNPALRGLSGRYNLCLLSKYISKT